MNDLDRVSWPGWETVQLIGRGSFGSVYEIQRDVFGDIEKAALKVISIPRNASDIDELYSDGYDDESITSTFQSHLKSIVAEYSLMRKMSSCANIVNCEDIRYVQHDDGIGWDIFIKMELLTPLTKFLPEAVPVETVVQIAKDMCVALDTCKQHDIIHRDIKPQNIFVSDNGDFKLGDFGIAKTIEKTMGGTKIGTYKYMAPEVYNNQPYGAAADIYSLGLVLYWLLNERRMPFLPLPPAKLKVGMEEHARQRRFAGEQIPKPAHGSEKLKEITLKACAYTPALRYASAREMLQQLQSECMGASGAHTQESSHLRNREQQLAEMRRKDKELFASSKGHETNIPNSQQIVMKNPVRQSNPAAEREAEDCFRRLQEDRNRRKREQEEFARFQKLQEERARVKREQEAQELSRLMEEEENHKKRLIELQRRILFDKEKIRQAESRIKQTQEEIQLVEQKVKQVKNERKGLEKQTNPNSSITDWDWRKSEEAHRNWLKTIEK